MMALQHFNLTKQIRSLTTNGRDHCTGDWTDFYMDPHRADSVLDSVPG